MSLPPSAVEPSDRWRLVGVDDPTTPPTISRLLDAVGTRAEWRRAGLPVTFDDGGEVRPVLRAGRAYRFELVRSLPAPEPRPPQPVAG